MKKVENMETVEIVGASKFRNLAQQYGIRGGTCITSVNGDGVFRIEAITLSGAIIMCDVIARNEDAARLAVQL